MLKLSRRVRVLATLCLSLCLCLLTEVEATCVYAITPGLAIESKHSMRITTVNTVEACLDFLELHSKSFALVAYNQEMHDCCTVSTTANYTLVENAAWWTFSIESAAITTQKPQLDTTKAPRPPSSPQPQYPSSAQPQYPSNAQSQYPSSAKPQSQSTQHYATTSGMNIVVPERLNEEFKLCANKVVDSIAIALYGPLENLNTATSWTDAETLCELNGMLLAQLPTESLFRTTEEVFTEGREKCASLEKYRDAFVGGHYSSKVGNYTWTEDEQVVNTPLINFSPSNAAVSFYQYYMNSAILEARSSVEKFENTGIICTKRSNR